MKDKQLNILVSYVLLFVTLATLTTSCKQKPSEDFQAVNILISNNSHQAQTKLDSLRNVTKQLYEIDKKYSELLQLKISDKTYKPIDDQKTKIDSLVVYFEKVGDSQTLTDAYYMAGRIYFELGDSPKALIFYQKAEKLVTKDNYALQGDILSQIAYIYQQCHLYKDAILTLQKACIADSLNESKQNMLFDLRDIGWNYYLVENYPQAIVYWEKGITMAKPTDVNLLKDFHYSLANLYIKTNNIKAAKYHTDKVLSLPKSNWSRKGFYCFLSKFYRKTGNIEAAKEYESWLADSGDIWAKRYVVEIRISEYLAQENTLKCRQEWNRYMIYSDSISKLTDIETIKRIEQLYNYKEKEKENKNLQEQNTSKNIIIATISLMMMFLLACAFLAYTSLKQKKKILELKIDKYETLKKEHKERNNKGLLNGQTEIKNSNFYKILMEKIKISDFSLDKEQWEELESTVNRTYIDFTKNLKSFYNISEHELKVCLMIKIGISPTNIAKFTNHSKEAINSTRGRLYAKVFNKAASAPKWDEFIRSL